MSAAEISRQLDLTSIKKHQWHIQACCALTGEGWVGNVLIFATMWTNTNLFIKYKNFLDYIKGWNGLYNASKRNDPMTSNIQAASYLLPTKQWTFRIAAKLSIALLMRYKFNFVTINFRRKNINFNFQVIVTKRYDFSIRNWNILTVWLMHSNLTIPSLKFVINNASSACCIRYDPFKFLLTVTFLLLVYLFAQRRYIFFLNSNLWQQQQQNNVE